MIAMTAAEIAAAAGGCVVAGDEGATVESVCTDSRAIAAGSLFIAIVGDSIDGHAHAAAAVAGGARAVMVSRWPLDNVTGAAVVKVDDTRRAMGRLATHVRRQFDGTVIAVAGSNGKTGTKHLIHGVLSTELAGTMSPKSFNNDVGVPITLFGVDEDDDFVVVEIGTNHPGEVRHLSLMCEPDIAIITSIGEEHMEFFGDLGCVRRENAQIVAGLRPGGRVFVCGDDVPLRELLPTAATFGFDEANGLRATGVRATLDGVTFAATGDEAQKRLNRRAPSNPPPPEGGGWGRGAGADRQRNARRRSHKTEFAKKLRTEMTAPERLLWSRLRRKQIEEYRFRRQQPIGPFVADFFCAKANLIIELDGISHETTPDADGRRQVWLEQCGFRVIRFTNDDLLKHLDAVVLEIERNLASAPPTLPSPTGGDGFAPTNPTATRTQFTLPLPGRHNASNALAAIAVGRAMGIDDDDIRHGLAHASSPEMRMQKRVVGGVTILNDAYNANPTSVRAALATVTDADWPGRKIVVLGEMRELGAYAAAAHREIFTLACASGFDAVYFVGEAFAAFGNEPESWGRRPARRLEQKNVARPDAHPTHSPMTSSGNVDRGSLPNAPAATSIFFPPDVPAAAAAVAAMAGDGDLVLLKASRGVRLERIETAITERVAGQRSVPERSL